MPSPTQITPVQLFRLIGLPDTPVLVDVCIDVDFADDPRLIPGAIKHPHTEIDTLAARLQGKNAVIICQKGKKISEGVAALLRCQGIAAENLAGGNFA